MVQKKLYTRRMYKEIMPVKSRVSSCGRTSKAPSKIMEQPMKVARKARLANMSIPKGSGSPLWKIIGGRIHHIKTILRLSLAHSPFFFFLFVVLQNIVNWSVRDIRALHKLLFYSIPSISKKDAIYNILEFSGFEQLAKKDVWY